MAAHPDILDRPEPLKVPFWTSFTLHVLAIASIFAGHAIEHRLGINMGDPNGGGFGVLVTPVSTIPLPNHGGPVNPVANDTKSEVPTPPPEKEKAKPAPPKPKPLTPDEILLQKMEKAPQRKPLDSQPNKYRNQQQYDVNQLYSPGGQRLSSPDFGKQGGGGVGLGNNSPFGDQFGYYANIIRENIARSWKPSTQGAPAVVVTFTIHRNGSVTNVTVEKSSGNQAMDNSAERAIYDAQLPKLPDNFPRNQADVELTFELGK